MRNTVFALTAFVLLAITNSHAAGSPYSITADSIYSHIAVLAHDSLEGRAVGEIGEQKAARYIISVFEQANIQPAGDSGYFQSFGFIKNIEFGPANSLTLNGQALEFETEFEPMKQSASMTFEKCTTSYGSCRTT